MRFVIKGTKSLENKMNYKSRSTQKARYYLKTIVVKVIESISFERKQFNQLKQSLLKT